MGGIGAGGSPAGQGSGGIAEKLSPTLRKPLSFTLQKPLSLITFFHIAKTAFPSLATRVEKPSTKNPRVAFPMTTVPGVSDTRLARVGCAFCAETIANEQKRSQMSMALCAKCAGKPRKAPESRKKPPEIAGAGAETGENAQE